MGAAALLAVGPVATLLGAVGADRLGMGCSPDAGPEAVVVGRAGQQLVQHVFDVGPDVEAVADRAGDEREEVGRFVMMWNRSSA